MTRSNEYKVCLVTGATSGIGLAVARGVAQKGFRTIIVGRNKGKCESACAGIAAETGNDKLNYLVADLSSMGEIRRLADEFKSRYDHLDALVNNAGARFLSRKTTVDGLEMTFALNHLAYFILTQLLLGSMRSAGHARIINVSSGAHQGVELDFDDLQNQKAYVGKVAYGQSKLANLLFTYELARRTSGSGITVNAVDPGVALTNFSKNNGWISWAKHVVAHVLARNLIGPRTAASTIISLATSPDMDGKTGGYYHNHVPVRPSDAAIDLNSADRLWQISSKLVNMDLIGAHPRTLDKSPDRTESGGPTDLH